MIDNNSLPHHIAIIMDGNGRWAKARGLPKMAGHRQGIESVRAAVEYCREKGIRILTVYAFSTENWKRPEEEVKTLMGFVKEYVAKEIDNFKKNQVRFNCIGRLDKLSPSVKESIEYMMEETKGCKELIFTLAINYGARSEIVDAVNKILDNGIKHVDEKDFSRFLYTRDLPDPDLLIRTSGEMRISNFLLWQVSYAEFYFTEKLWPDFRKPDLEEAVKTYQNRSRRFGG